MKTKVIKPFWLTAVLWLAAMTANAQGFDLYFANNVTDVENLTAETVEEYQNGLKWTKIERGTVNVYGNYVEMDEVRQMFASTRMKTRADQEQFWRMRDHSLLCFRINDGDGKTGEYGVEADDGYGNKLSLTVTKYFYSNIPLQDKPVTFKVWKIGEIGDTLRFKYASDDWNDDQLYIFQLDSKRQIDGESYTLEYDLSYADDQGELQEEKHYLDLKDKNFQSFYVESDKTLADIFLMAGSTTAPKEGRKKLRLNLKRLITGVSPYNKYYNLTLTTNFRLDKHENRELVNFNWIGSGLYERFDTLYVKLKKPNGDDIRSARMNVVQVDLEGNEVAGGAPVSYYGWDERRKVHKVITNGNPAYIEILPPARSNTFFPMVLKYRGATDPLTNIVEEERCTAEVMAVMGNVNYADFAISSQYFRGLHDEKKIVMYRGEEHALVTLEEYNLTGCAVTDEVRFSSDGCQDGLKLFKGSPIDKYGELLLTFSTPKGGPQTLRRAMASTPELKVYDVDGGDALLQTIPPQVGATGVSLSKFERDYYEVGYDLTDLTADKKCRLKLQADDKTYDKLPYFSRFTFDRSENEDDAHGAAQELMRGIIDGDKPKAGDANADAKAEWAIPVNFRWESPINGLYIDTSLMFSLTRKCIDYKICAEYKKKSNHTDAQGRPDGSKVSKMREDFDTHRNWNKVGTYWNEDQRKYDFSKYNVMKTDEANNKGVSGGLVSEPAQQKLENWVFSEFDDIFSLPVPGFSVTGGLKIAGSITKLGKDKDKDGNAVEGAHSIPTISDVQVYFKLAYGAFIANPLQAIGGQYLGAVGGFLEKYANFLTISALAEASLEISVGYKNWQANDLGYSSKSAHSLLVQAMLKGRGGICAEVHTPPNPVLHLGAGVRAGAKLGIGYGFCTDFDHFDHGAVFIGLLGVEAFAYVRSIAGTAQAAAEVHLGDRILFPNNDNTNPFHPKYPYRAVKVQPASAPQGGGFWQNPSLKAATTSTFTTNASASNDNTDNDKDRKYGQVVVDNVASTANPHFFDENTIVYDVPSTPEAPNSGYIAVKNLDNGTVYRISAEGLKAQNHMRSKNTYNEVVVYEEMSRPITAEEMQTDDAAAKTVELAKEQSIMSSIRDAELDGSSWHRYTVSAATGDMVKAKPVVTMQEDGRAACVWQQGQLKPVSSDLMPTGNAGEIAGDNEAFGQVLDGHLVLSIYDEGQWSDPINLFELNETNVAKQYDLVMRNDTVLVGMNMTRNFYDDEKRCNQFTYASIPFDTRKPSYVDEQLHPKRFFMNRVGGHALVALLYEKNDTLSDIYVKAVNMDGTLSGVGGNDLGANFCSPNLVKVICDRESAVLSDCAILWTEVSNTVHGDQGTAEHNGDARMILNASRISLEPSICVTSPLTMGAETEGRLLNDFDGFLDDQHMKVVYSLSSMDENEPTVIRANERYFDNSFVFDVNYNKTALMGSSTLPITVSVYNTGTSAIRTVIPTINGQTFTLGESWVQPLSQRDFIVQYPIDSNFDGYLQATVEVEYQNMFRARQHALNPRRSLVRQRSQAVARGRASLEDVELRVIGQDIEDGVNTFAVELIDHSPRGLRADNVIHVGIFSQPSPSSLISDEAETLVRASDFEWFGGVRKAYAKVQLQGIAETTNAFLACHILDESQTDPDADNYVENLHYSENIHYVYLQPSNDPTAINPVRFDENKRTLDVKVVPEEGGVRITGLPVSDDTRQYRIRVFDADGMLRYGTISQSSTLFVPLYKHGVYLLSTGKDVLKFNY